MIELFVDVTQRRGISTALFEQIRSAIVTGRLAEGDRMPPTRELAEHLGVSRQTITTVYGLLVAEGYLEGRAGGGTFVCHTTTPTPARRRPVSPLAPIEAFEPDAPAPPARAGCVDLRIGQPDPALFPLTDWRHCVVSALQQSPPNYGDPAGSEELRRSLAHWIGMSRGVDVGSDQLVVTAGAQHAIYLVARVLLRPGDTVAVEDPGYPPIRRLFVSLGMRVMSVPVDENGIAVDRLPAGVKVIYVTPSHQSPTGVTMSRARRRELLAFAERHGVAIVEDDYDSEYRHTDRPLEPLQRLDRTGRVIYIGTFSKTLAPSIRFGFVALPDSLVDAVVAWRQLADWQPPDTTQDAMHRFITSGMLDRHLRKVRKIYRERHNLVIDAAHSWHDAGLIAATPNNHAGLHLSLRLPDGATETSVINDLRGRGVGMSTLADCTHLPTPNQGLLIGFGLTDRDALPAALEQVGRSLAVGRRACLVRAEQA
jgi:GntR family transcriptional regulator / MocR family aminotransferase